jgi:hypothetical protein
MHEGKKRDPNHFDFTSGVIEIASSGNTEVFEPSPDFR